jgi:RimJ/RimL family protein N-acetyltransferase
LSDVDFANDVANDSNFTHFTHHMPIDMLTAEWEVSLIKCALGIMAWGQIQKFPDNPRKQHVVRIGFVVHPKFRGMGYGSIILNHIILERCKHYKKITATVFQDNLIMLGMFLRRNFIVEGCFQNEEFSNGGYRHVLSLARCQGRIFYE